MEIERNRNKPLHRVKYIREGAKRQRESGKQKEWQENNREKTKQYSQNYRQHKNHNITEEEWRFCKRYFNYECAYCGVEETEVKLSQGQYFHKEHFNNNGENDLSNCVPACKSCNSKKSEFDFYEWYIPENPIYNLNRLNKIQKWINEDYKLFTRK